MVHNIPACHKRIAKGTSSFHFHTKFTRGSQGQETKPTNGISQESGKFYKRIVFAIMHQYGKSNLVNHRNRKEVTSHMYNDHYISGWSCIVISFDCRWEMKSRVKSKALSPTWLMATISPPPLTSSSQVKVSCRTREAKHMELTWKSKQSWLLYT